MASKIVVLSGAGISAESGISTFRDANGLWNNYDIMEVASIDGWRKNPELVLEFYNQRRRQLHDVEPNAAHRALVDLEQAYEVVIITQNVDNLHERAGSSQVLHLHGELFKARSTQDASVIYDRRKDIHLGDTCELGSQLRPHIVWFGEEVPMMLEAVMAITQADIVVIIGTSMVVYPAAGLVDFAPPEASLYYIDPQPNINYELSQRKNLTILKHPATIGTPQLVRQLLSAVTHQ